MSKQRGRPPVDLPTKSVRVREDLLEKAEALLNQATGAQLSGTAITSAGLSLVIGRAERRYHTTEEVQALIRDAVARNLCVQVQQILSEREGQPVRVDFVGRGDRFVLVITIGDTTTEKEIPSALLEWNG